MNPTGSPPALELRDIHLPPEPSWWPPAPGWWLLAVLLLIGMVFVLLRLRRRMRIARERRALLQQLQRLRQQHPVDQVPAATLAAASELLRRACRKHAPDALALKGEAWLQFLDHGLADAPFTTGAGRQLLDGPFRPVVDPDEARAALDAVARRLPRLVVSR